MGFSMEKKYLVVGFGVSGQTAARVLLQGNKKVWAADLRVDALRSDPKVQDLLDQGVELFSDSVEISWGSIACVILSPGVPQENPLVQQALSSGVEIIGEAEFALRHIDNRCIGVTGTNGKTTTVFLITHILSSVGIEARALGNIGKSLSSYLLDPHPEEILIVELSSFQLETMQTKRFEAAILLNITPDHLDRYRGLEAYAAAKFRLRHCLLPGGVFFLSHQVQKQWKAEGEIFDPPLEPVPWEEVCSPKDSLLSGVPERQNIWAAYRICRRLGVSLQQFQEALKTFRKPPHRIEWVAEKNGSVYYNDSKATNLDSVIHALALFEKPVILLVGGVDKGAPYAPWIDCFRDKVKMIIAFGAAAFKMESELSGFFPFYRTATMEEAVELASKLTVSGTTVLLSPGCSSYDQFRNYEHRGDEFKRLVRGLK